MNSKGFLLKNSKLVFLIIVIAFCLAIAFGLGSIQIFEFLNEFFISPLGRSYNPVNSAVYALLLFAGILLLSRILPRLKVKVDEKFVVALLPFILLGSCLRVFQDAQIINSPMLISPLIYVLVFIYTFVCLLVSLMVAKKTGIAFHCILFVFGTVPAAYFAFQLVLRIINFESIILTCVYSGAACFLSLAAFYGINKLVNFDKFALDLGIVFSHMFDVSATYVGVTFYGYGEQHFLVRFFTEIFGSALIFYFLDFLVIVLVLFTLERILQEEQELLGLFRLTLIVLGLAPALRDILRVALLA